MKRKRGGGTPASPSAGSVNGDSQSSSEDELLQDTVTVETPSKRQRRPATKFEAGESVTGTPTKTAATPTKPKSTHTTPKSQRKVNFDTPLRVNGGEEDGSTSFNTPNADRSARRKSSGRFIERTLEDGHSEDGISDSDEDVVRALVGVDEEADDDVDASVNGLEEGIDEPETPSKRPRGRPKGRSRKRSPTPPQNLPPHEQYFWQNRPGGNKTSMNTLSADTLLNHDEYFQQMQTYKEPHQEQQDFLLSLHARSYPQWQFELEQGFNICLYGYGSKRQLLTNFANYLHAKLDDPPKTVIVNGYAPGLTVRDVLTLVASTLLPSHLQLPVQPPALLELIIEALSMSKDTTTNRILLLLNSIDASSLRRPAVQQILATLAAHAQVSLIATADHINFPLLWDTSLRSQFHFVFHDTTTFAPYTAELVDVVESVNDLLGRSGRRGIGGKDGIAFVLRSLPANARSLFRVLVAEQVAASFSDEGQGAAGAALGEDLDGLTGGAMAGIEEEGVEYRLLYRKACEELICTNENGFRTLLKEFFDHQMVESRRDALGTERLAVPFRKEELEALLEELVD